MATGAWRRACVPDGECLAGDRTCLPSSRWGVGAWGSTGRVSGKWIVVFISALTFLYLDLPLKGVPRWCDRFGQYGIKVSFWASETLKIVISSKTSPRNDVFGWLIMTPSGVGGVD